ncbi:microfibrillar-associated protein 2 isoform X2 [Echinops telfairi]|uniref:Microfibrillar-associated protein 2 isoform X2 n=1 Tax=Echinops telfairi TaxID=9371 RepID=A0AC55DTD4_ECHTE|nr:microfibrillar-associated protein 2 isoform X2 [Echinops telfairi]
MRAACLFLLALPGLLAQGQYDLDPLPLFPDHLQYTHYSDQIDTRDYYDYQEVSPRPEEQLQFQSQQQVAQEVTDLEPANPESEPTEPGPLDCREEQYPCTRLYSIHKPCKQCLNEVCFYSLRRVYVINKEICVRTVCAHEELLRGGETPAHGPVPRQVLQVRRDGQQRPVQVCGGLLRPELRGLLDGAALIHGPLARPGAVLLPTPCPSNLSGLQTRGLVGGHATGPSPSLWPERGLLMAQALLPGWGLGPQCTLLDPLKTAPLRGP